MSCANGRKWTSRPKRADACRAVFTFLDSPFVSRVYATTREVRGARGCQAPCRVAQSRRGRNARVSTISCRCVHFSLACAIAGIANDEPTRLRFAAEHEGFNLSRRGAHCGRRRRWARASLPIWGAALDGARSPPSPPRWALCIPREVRPRRPRQAPCHGAPRTPRADRGDPPAATISPHARARSPCAPLILAKRRRPSVARGDAVER